MKIKTDEETYACCALLVGACLVAEGAVKKKMTWTESWLAQMNKKDSYLSIHRELITNEKLFNKYLHMSAVESAD